MTKNHEINMDKLCSGCLIYERHLTKPNTYGECKGFVIKDINCPCINCLIKAMCVTSCDGLFKRNWLKLKK